MATSQLLLYNDALGGHLGERILANLSENREPRRFLDAVYSMVLDECIEGGYWKHARRTVQLTASNSLTPQFGYEWVFDVPSDCLQVYLVSLTPDGKPPLNDYVLENGFIRTHSEVIYLTYISNDASYGLSLTKWAPSFNRWVAAELAARICYRITQSKDLTDTIEKRAAKLKRRALSLDAREGPAPERPTGSWVQSRRRGGLGPDTRIV